MVYKQASDHSEELRHVENHSELHFNHGCEERVIPGLKEHVFQLRKTELETEHAKDKKQLEEKMKKIKSIVNSQKCDIIILLILNSIQLKEAGFIYINIDEKIHQLTLIEFETDRHLGFQK